MVFSSFVFLCFFLPIVLILHTLVKNITFRNGLLIFASVIFYAYGEPAYVILLILSVLANYLFGVLVEKHRSKGLLALVVTINIGLLVIFKYLGLIVTTINACLLGQMGIPVPAISLPIGISFYTFQALSYVIDVYRGDVKVQKNFFSLLLYISFFPQLIAGPIVKYHDVEQQIMNRQPDTDGIKNGIFRFCCGLGKKMLISNAVAYVADTLFAFENNEIGLFAAWMGAIAYLMQIYFDFSGYSDMAIGLGEMFGFHFLENFNHPYISDSIQEFWRRWHISLSTWFREYLYIPLGGNRKGKFRTYLNRYIVFAATGIWHGANYTFLIWGLFHGTFLVLESSGIIPIKKCKWKAVRIIYTMLLVTIGFVMFRADDVMQGLTFIKAMFGLGASGGMAYVSAMSFLSPYYIFIFILAIIGATEYPIKLFRKILPSNTAAGNVVRMVLSVISLLLCYMSLASDSYNPFIYFRF